MVTTRHQIRGRAVDYCGRRGSVRLSPQTAAMDLRYLACVSLTKGFEDRVIPATNYNKLTTRINKITRKSAGLLTLIFKPRRRVNSYEMSASSDSTSE